MSLVRMARGTAAERSHFLRFSRAEKMDILVTGNTVLTQALEYKILHRNILRFLDMAILALEFSMLSTKGILSDSMIKTLDLPFLLTVAFRAIAARKTWSELTCVLVLVAGKTLVFIQSRPFVFDRLAFWGVALRTF